MNLFSHYIRGTLLAISVFLCAIANSAENTNSATSLSETSNNPNLEDQCIGGTAHELVAQANIVTAKKYHEYGLSEELSVSCPRFVWVVLQADSLSSVDKKRAFADVMNWSPDQRMKFFVPLKDEVDKAAEAYWKQGTNPN